MRPARARLALVLSAALLAAALGACGKKGDLDPPPGAVNEYPRQYPR